MSKLRLLIAAPILFLLVAPTTRPVVAATDDMNLTGLILLGDGTPLGSTMWADNTSFAIYVDHGNNWSDAWRFPALPQWYTTSMGAYSIVLPAIEKDKNWSDGDWYRVQVDVGNILGSPGLLMNATSNGTGDPGEYTPYGFQNNSIVWSVLDNWQRWDVRLIEAPDLCINDTGVKLTPTGPFIQGDLTAINATVNNLGGLDAINVTIRFTDGVPPGGTGIGSDHIIPIIPAGDFIHAEQTWIASPTGSHTLCVIADPDDVIIETNETNNMMCVDTVVQPGPIMRPDYLPIGMQPPSPVRTGMSSPVQLSVQVLNQGNGTATSDATVAFYEPSSPPFFTSVLSPLAPAMASSRFTATWTSPATPGTYTVSVDVDYYDNVTEWDETNNAYTWTIEVVEGPITSLVIGDPNYTTTVTYLKSSTPLDLSIIDQSGTGIRYTTYRIDNTTWENYTATGQFFMAGEGDHYIEWYSEDNVGNVENITAMVLRVDDTPPATTISPATGEFNLTTIFTLSATDGGSGVKVTRYRIDGGSPTDYSTGFTLTEGDHNVSFFSMDNLDNTEEEKWLVVTIQGPPQPNTPPTVTLTSPIGGEEFLKGSVHAVTWTMHDEQDINANLTVYINYTTGGTTYSIVAAVKGIESFLWTLPDIEASDVVVNVTVIDSGGLRGWDESGPFTIKTPPSPPGVEANYKPVVAVIFAIVLLVAGLWSSRKRPWRGGKDRMAVMKAFAITSLPFVFLEIATGILSMSLEPLRVPPAIGWGTGVDVLILAVGITFQFLRLLTRKEIETDFQMSGKDE